MASVAGQIRIDLIANTAKFSAGMREAGQGLNSFREQFQQVQASFNSQKAVGARINAEAAAWKSSMKELRADIAPSMNARGSMLPWYSMERMNLQRDPAQERQTRLKSLLPWGTTVRTTLTREAAETAAAIGAGGRKIGYALTAAHHNLGMLVGEIGGAAGFGGLARFFMSPTGIATGGVALLGAKMVRDTMERDRWVAEVGHMARTTGQGVQDTSKLMYAGFNPQVLARFQKAIYEGKPEQQQAFQTLGLDRDTLSRQPLLKTMQELAAGFDRVLNPTERATLAIDLFGKAGAEMLPVLQEFTRKLKDMPSWKNVTPRDVQNIEAGEAAQEGARAAFRSGFGKWLDRFWEQAIHTVNYISYSENSEGGTLDEWNRVENRRRKEDSRAEHADEIEAFRVQKDRVAAEAAIAAETQAELKTKRDSLATAEKTRARLLREAEFGPEDSAAVARSQFIESIDKAGIRDTFDPRYADRTNPFQFRERAIEQYDRAAQARKEREDKEGRQKLAQSRLESLRPPEETFGVESEKIAGMLRDKEISPQAAHDLRLGLLKNYYREAAGLDAKQLRDSLKHPYEEYQERKRWLDKMAADGLLTPGESGRLGGEARRGMLGKLGIGDPLGDYGRALADLNAAAGEMTGDQYSRRRKQLRKSALGELVDGAQAPQLIGAAEKGSAAAYSIIANAMGASGADALAREANSKLDAIERNTRPGGAPKVFNMN